MRVALRAFVVSAFVLALNVTMPDIAAAQSTPSQQVIELLERRQPDSALSVIDIGLQTDSTNLSLLLAQHQAHLLRDDTVRGISSLKRAVGYHAYNTQARTTLVALLLARGQSDSALHYVRQTPVANRPRSADGLLLWGRVYLANGVSDSAIAFFKQAYRLARGNKLPLPPVPEGTRVSSLNFSDGRGSTVSWNPGRPTILVFWAQWSSTSEDALRDVSMQVKKAAMTWKLIPVNVDVPSGADVKAINAKATSLGCTDTVRFDANWALARAWELDHVPAIVTIDYGGLVTDIVYGWDDSSRAAVLDGALSALRDSAHAPTPRPPDTVRTRALNLHAQARHSWRTGNADMAVRSIQRSVNADSTYCLSLVEQAAYRWSRGDSAGARLLGDKLLKLHSDQAWARISAAHMMGARGRYADAVAILTSPGLAAQSSADGAMQASLAWMAARAGLWQLSQTARERCQSMNRFDSLIPEIDALLAEHFTPDSAAIRWREAAENALR